ncbi:hypothetical protein JDV02_002771 [Purpureocillium takamizusanense]|uniref:Killer toxin Kp4 domain-containing protein n=1 Tax=Purpureocillium takamizusanense TaxID=2060973 RepID=A0A9Q8QBN1_9HYPO|nr:uncharacterized protein JDV02_002771 [Purpureocillium takamizusanense]UNI16333.1 hypothetical protein JDV02_002771 [Purpureocillium takamizusanense]
MAGINTPLLAAQYAFALNCLLSQVAALSICKLATMVTVTALAAFVSGAAALGINCRGSGGCTFNNAKLSNVLTQVKQIQAQGNGRHHYGTGVQLACDQGQYSSICAFYQNGASGTADRAAELLQGLIDHGYETSLKTMKVTTDKYAELLGMRIQPE